jgi:hypothetical protein
MSNYRFAIDEDGQVYSVNGRLRHLGHITSITEETPLARAVRDWWRRMMTSAEPIPEVHRIERENGHCQLVVTEPQNS